MRDLLHTPRVGLLAMWLAQLPERCLLRQVWREEVTDLEKARANLAQLEAQLPPGVQYMAPLARLLAAIGGVRNRIRMLEAQRLPVVANPEVS